MTFGSCLTIAEIPISFKVIDKLSDYLIQPNYLPFISQDYSCEGFRVFYTQFPKLNLFDPNFEIIDCGPIQILCMLKKQIFYYVVCANNDRNDPKLLAIIDCCFCSGDIYIRDEYYYRHKYLYPLANDFIDHFIFLGLLTLGHGIRIHGSGISINGNGYIFTGESGVGKSTLSNLFKENKDITILSDEYIVVRKIDGEYRIYGTPWVSDANCFSNSSAKLEKVFFINHDFNNNITDVDLFEATVKIMKQTFARIISFDSLLMGSRMKFIIDYCTDLARAIPCYRFGFTPTKEAVTTICRFI